MASETAHLPGDREAMLFAAGCLRAAAAERLRSFAPDPAWAGPGVAAGAMLAAHAAIDGSGAWPLFWPLIAGAAVVLANGGRFGGLGAAAWSAFKAGAIGGLLLFSVAAAAALLGSGSPEPAAHMLGRVGIAAAAAAALAAVAGLAVAPLVCRASAPTSFSPERKDRR
ncbi:MAG TPA: hypothetical protein VEZ20_02485 [Allosphingosinicella sp.]|nr:hypothetical protein [Allosphingosinicella sp.]